MIRIVRSVFHNTQYNEDRSKKRKEDCMRTLFHVTPLSNVDSILKDGLTPQLGERSRQLEDEKEGVFMFSDYENCEYALYSWLGKELEELEEALMTLKVELPLNFPLDQEVEWELIARKTIHPKYISIYKNEG